MNGQQSRSIHLRSDCEAQPVILIATVPAIMLGEDQSCVSWRKRVVESRQRQDGADRVFGANSIGIGG